MPDASARFSAVALVNSRQPRRVQRPVGANGKVQDVGELFGQKTFSLEQMADKLPRPIFKQLAATIEEGRQLDHPLAVSVAHAVKDWAVEQGCTHFTHWFQPMTGSTAEKHDAFLTFSKAGQAIERFTGDMLIQSEPDASSFPSGGMRSTFEARGYTAWDPSSPMFIMEGESGSTLCIPSVFISYTGHALDQKTPLLRSMAAVNKAAQKLLVAMGETSERVVATVGCEQEYFLIDRAYWALRPDLAIAGRTVVGANPPKGQSLDDHYFGAIPPRVLSFMQEVEQELYLLGVPAKTRHNEVAPCQFELAPIFREANVGVDHNQLISEVLRRVALRHDYKVIMHEKPFANINGSGKHDNWSLSTGGKNLLDPGKQPQENTRFLAVLASVLLGVQRYGGLLRASVASHGNDFRLGANEAPPAIMSVFLGETLTRICNGITAGTSERTPDQAKLTVGVDTLPAVAQDNTDRNRTSPVAFTGNKFEFRAVGSSQNPGWPTTVLNTIVSEGMDQITTWIAEAGGDKAAVMAAIRKALIESEAVRFEGDGYSDDWVTQAQAKGLKNLRTTPEALDELRLESVERVFGKHGVLSPEELLSRFKVQEEQYLTAVDIERDTLRLIVNETVMPAALAERGELAIGAKALADLGLDCSIEKERIALLNQAVLRLKTRGDAVGELAVAAGHDAHKVADTVVPALAEVRAVVDELEGLVSDGRWPLPKYRELLFTI